MRSQAIDSMMASRFTKHISIELSKFLDGDSYNHKEVTLMSGAESTIAKPVVPNKDVQESYKTGDTGARHDHMVTEGYSQVKPDTDTDTQKTKPPEGFPDAKSVLGETDMDQLNKAVAGVKGAEKAKDDGAKDPFGKPEEGRQKKGTTEKGENRGPDTDSDKPGVNELSKKQESFAPERSKDPSKSPDSVEEGKSKKKPDEKNKEEMEKLGPEAKQKDGETHDSADADGKTLKEEHETHEHGQGKSGNDQNDVDRSKELPAEKGNPLQKPTPDKAIEEKGKEPAEINPGDEGKPKALEPGKKKQDGLSSQGGKVEKMLKGFELKEEI